MRTKVKICGITSIEDALTACEGGADAVGFVFWEKSPRFIPPESAARITRMLPPFVATVGVFVDEDADTINRTARTAGLSCVQLHGDEDPETCGAVEVKVIKAVRIKGPESLEGLERFDVSAYLLDTFKEGVPGGTGAVFDWEIARKARSLGHIILSGGLTPDNVADAVSFVKPYAVDVSSGVESRPGRKDPVMVARFIESAKSIDI